MLEAVARKVYKIKQFAEPLLLHIYQRMPWPNFTENHQIYIPYLFVGTSAVFGKQKSKQIRNIILSNFTFYSLSMCWYIVCGGFIKNSASTNFFWRTPAKVWRNCYGEFRLVVSSAIKKDYNKCVLHCSYSGFFFFSFWFLVVSFQHKCSKVSFVLHFPLVRAWKA